MIRVYCKTAAAIAWFYLALRYLAGANYESVAATVKYFSYFTMLSNLGAAVALAALGWRPAKLTWLTGPAALTGIALCMSVTGLSFVHAASWQAEGWLFVSDSGLHHVMPIVFLGFWMVYVPKGTLELRHLSMWLIFPILYAIYTQLHGSPYPFLDAEQVGRVQVAVNMGLMLFSFATLGGAFLVVDRRLGRGAPQMASAH
jgi:hypothetical protein